MKYTHTIIINISLPEFVKVLTDYNALKYWQRGFISFEHLSGDFSRVGGKIKQNYNFGKDSISVIQTVTHSNLPYEIFVNYDTEGMCNRQKNHFSQLSENQIKWVCKTQCIPTSLYTRMLTVFMPRVFKKQTAIYLNDFKNYAEKGLSVNNEKT
ncbi:SRPBCC family protein [Bizionia gelidisalsuginis]|uniref:SRPBCC family protein n=2 Tax=Bizionia TaxID=283785 RepID=A0A8H2QFK2_9FLAO|nr:MULTISPECIES: SRPBCC family protein [Bizionia]TYB80102.1 SRPBCC family protein [Bizionia saleffrena]TYC09733.1 SRPBCC family protein [Bizionia gelidisalsuginis]